MLTSTNPQNVSWTQKCDSIPSTTQEKTIKNVEENLSIHFCLALPDKCVLSRSTELAAQ
jgi:hypothetical protein